AERKDRQSSFRFTREQNAARHFVHRPVTADGRDHVVAWARLTRQRYRVTRCIGDDVVRLNPVRLQFNQQLIPSPRRTTCRRAKVGDQKDSTFHKITCDACPASGNFWCLTDCIRPASLRQCEIVPAKIFVKFTSKFSLPLLRVPVCCL